MKPAMTLACSMLTIGLAVSLGAQAPPATITDAEYAKAMKEIGSTLQSLRKNLYELVNPAASEAANVARAIAAIDSKGLNDAMVMLEGLGKEPGVGGTCAACHMTHRERLPDGSFRIK